MDAPAFRVFRVPKFFVRDNGLLATHQYSDMADLFASLGDKVIAPAEAKELERR